MFSYLDVLVIVFAALAIAGVLAMVLMFFGKKAWQRKLGFYVTAALGIYVATVSVRVLSVMFPLQYALGIAMGILSVVAMVLEVSGKGRRSLARMLAAVSLVVGMINAFIW